MCGSERHGGCPSKTFSVSFKDVSMSFKDVSKTFRGAKRGCRPLKKVDLQKSVWWRVFACVPVSFRPLSPVNCSKRIDVCSSLRFSAKRNFGTLEGSPKRRLGWGLQKRLGYAKNASFLTGAGNFCAADLIRRHCRLVSTHAGLCRLFP